MKNKSKPSQQMQKEFQNIFLIFNYRQTIWSSYKKNVHDICKLYKADRHLHSTLNIDKRGNFCLFITLNVFNLVKYLHLIVKSVHVSAFLNVSLWDEHCQQISLSANIDLM